MTATSRLQTNKQTSMIYTQKDCIIVEVMADLRYYNREWDGKNTVYWRGMFPLFFPLYIHCPRLCVCSIIWRGTRKISYFAEQFVIFVKAVLAPVLGCNKGVRFSVRSSVGTSNSRQLYFQHRSILCNGIQKKVNGHFFKYASQYCNHSNTYIKSDLKLQYTQSLYKHEESYGLAFMHACKYGQTCLRESP